LLHPKGEPGDGHPVRALLHESCDTAKDAARLLRDWLAERSLPQGIGREVRPLIYNAWVTQRAFETLRSHPPAAIVERLSLFGCVGLDLAAMLNVPLVLEVNAPLAQEAGTFRALQLQSLAAEIETRVLRGADRIAVVSNQLGDRLIAEGVDARKVDVVPNGVDPSEFDRLSPRDVIRAELGLSDAFVVGFVGSLKPWHGVDVLLQAFASLTDRDPAARLLLVGTGPAAAELRAAVAEKGLGNRVTFTGAVPHEEVPKFLRAMDVAVAPFLPLEDFYFSPIKLFEYMASGTCVVASRMGQIAEVIHDGIDGLLCLPGDADDLAVQIDRARRSPALRAELAARARTKVLDRYTWRHTAKALVDCVGTVLRGRATRTSLPRRTETTAA
jgi:glycosyltransferase involved in cell wall biosynthesis